MFVQHILFSFPGNLYYALTHSPEPLTEDYSHALSWQAATERLEAAGSIPLREAEAMAEAVSANEAGIEASFYPDLLAIFFISFTFLPI